jgi:hypothetical protein
MKWEEETPHEMSLGCRRGRVGSRARRMSCRGIISAYFPTRARELVWKSNESRAPIEQVVRMLNTAVKSLNLRG